MTLQSLGKTGREAILATAVRYGAHNVRVFGSVARGEADDLSDLDLLVDLDSDRTLMDLGGLLMDLRAQLRMRVDVTTEGMLRPEIRDRVLSEAVPLRETIVPGSAIFPLQSIESRQRPRWVWTRFARIRSYRSGCFIICRLLARRAGV